MKSYACFFVLSVAEQFVVSAKAQQTDGVCLFIYTNQQVVAPDVTFHAPLVFPVEGVGTHIFW